MVELCTDAAPGLCFLLHSLGVDWMMVARHFRCRLLILSVSILGFFISSFSAVLASDFSGPVVSVLDGDTTVHVRCGGCVLAPILSRPAARHSPGLFISF